MTRRLAIVGSGFFSQFHVEAWARLDVTPVGICSLDASTAEAHAARLGGVPVFSDVADMLRAASPDLVDVITPPETHLGIIRQTLAAGIATICQKPFCGGLAGAREAARLAEESGVPLIVHENFRYQPWFAEIKDRLNVADLGDVYGASFRLRPGDGQGPDAYLARQPYFQTMPRLLVHETLVHLIDVMRYLFGEVTGVYATLRRLNPVIAGEDAGLIVLDFECGQQVTIDGNRLVDHAAKNRRLVMGEMVVEGSGAVLSLDGDGGIQSRAHGENTAVDVPYDWQDNGYAGDCVYRLQADILRCLETGQSPPNKAGAYVRNLELVEAVYQSAADGRRIGV